jgi:hypothetical protein
MLLINLKKVKLQCPAIGWLVPIVSEIVELRRLA